MPRRIKHLCNNPGCPKLTLDRFCPEHTKKVRSRYDAERGSSSKRGYDRTWKRVRLLYIQEHPLCEDCEDRGFITPADLVDHVIPISEGGDRLNFNNLRSLCTADHENKHKHERFRRREVRV